MASQRRHVVAVRLGHLGDLVMVLPALRWLVRHPELRVTLVTGSSYVTFLAHHLSEVDVVSAQDVGTLEPAHAVLDLHGVPASRRVIQRVPRFLRAARVATRKESLRRRSLLLAARWPRVLGSSRLRHAPLRSWPERHLAAVAELFARLGLPESGWPARPSSIPELVADRMEEANADGTLSGPILGLCPGASWETKRWPVRHWSELSTLWSKRERGGSWLFGSPGESSLLEQIAVDGVSEPWPDSSLGGLIEGLASCDVVVCGDSGPLHLAGALGVPVVGLYGPTPQDAGFWVWQERGVQLPETSPPCAPCSLHGQARCPLSHHRCLEELDPQRVLDAAVDLARPRETPVIRAGKGFDVDLVETVRSVAP